MSSARSRNLYDRETPISMLDMVLYVRFKCPGPAFGYTVCSLLTHDRVIYVLIPSGCIAHTHPRAQDQGDSPSGAGTRVLQSHLNNEIRLYLANHHKAFTAVQRPTDPSTAEPAERKA